MMVLLMGRIYELDSCTLKYISSFTEIGSAIQMFMGGGIGMQTDTQTAWWFYTPILIFFKRSKMG
jgi:hypothetical protein